jgi:hypothetical protein
MVNFSVTEIDRTVPKSCWPAGLFFGFRGNDQVLGVNCQALPQEAVKPIVMRCVVYPRNNCKSVWSKRRRKVD